MAGYLDADVNARDERTFNFTVRTRSCTPCVSAYAHRVLVTMHTVFYTRARCVRCSCTPCQALCALP
eukprot:2030824-Rhodomonas_salina.1